MTVTLPRVLHSEWTKLRSVRSTGWTLLGAGAVLVGVGAAPAASTTDPQADPVSVSLNGVGFAQLVVGALGVLVMSSEYGTGTIRSSLAVVPRRLPMFLAKVLAVVAVVLPAALAGCLASFLLGQALLRDAGLGVGLGAPGAVRSVVGAALYLTVGGVVGVALGTLLRSTAAGLATFTVGFLVLPPLAQVLPPGLERHVSPYLPANAGGAVYRDYGGLDWLSPGAGFAVLCGYAAVLVGLAAWRLLSTDA